MIDLESDCPIPKSFGLSIDHTIGFPFFNVTVEVMVIICVCSCYYCKTCVCVNTERERIQVQQANRAMKKP